MANESLRRKKFTRGWLRVIVDGVEQLSWEASRARNSAEIAIGSNAELVELRANDAEGDLLLASHLIRRDEAEAPRKPQRYSIVLEGGQEVSISVTYHSRDEFAGCTMAFTYKERPSVIVALSSFRSFFGGLLAFPLQARQRAAVSIIALSAICLVFAVIGLMRFKSEPIRVETAPPTGVPKGSPEKSGMPGGDPSPGVVAQEGPPGSSTEKDRAAVQTAEGKPTPEARVPEVSTTNGARLKETLEKGDHSVRRKLGFPSERLRVSVLEL